LKKGVLIFNPFATSYNPRIPNTILQVAASVQHTHEWAVVDGNIDKDPWQKIEAYLKSGKFHYFGCTVMPGPQLRQAIPYSKKIREQFPEVIIVWGGYFASNQYQTSLNSGFIDFIINGPGDYAFPELLKALENKEDFSQIKNLIYKKEGTFIKTPKAELANMDALPPLPYEAFHQFYDLNNYLCKTFLGKKTMSYHSSFGCPFTCSFCAVVPIYNARWKGKSAELIYQDVKYLQKKYKGDALEFHDNNFFVSEKRTVAFSKLIALDKITWWGEARIDTMDKYSDESLRILSESGCRMIFFGAETGNDEVLKQMDKGGTQTGEQIIRFAERLKKFDIIPEYSFVLGTPAATEEEVNKRIDEDIAFIKKVKAVNPKTEIIIYIYSPVPTEGSELYNQVIAAGFRFPEQLEEWTNPQWESFDLRKNPLTPWLKPYMVDKIKNFETVLNGRYPSHSDTRLTPLKRKMIKAISAWRYKTNVFAFPKEIRFLHRVWKYRQPEIEGF
jgi:anaerobic magnesium-protoporphyrin IX monomethyl ester cyclase